MVLGGVGAVFSLSILIPQGYNTLFALLTSVYQIIQRIPFLQIAYEIFQGFNTLLTTIYSIIQSIRTLQIEDLIFQGYNTLFALLTTVYPIIQSIRTLQIANPDGPNYWLCYWTIFGLFKTFELFFGFIFYFIPYWSIIRLAFFVYLIAPQTQGLRTLYTVVFRPFLKKQERN